MRPMLALALALLTASPALAWEPIASSRPTWDGPAPYVINQTGSSDLGASVSEAELRRGMEDWSTPACSGLNTSYGGTTTRQPGTYEGESVMGWVESGWRHSSSAIGVTGTRYTSSSIVEADMEMNGVHFRWTTGPGSGSSVNAYSIALHESGHYLGLGHTSDPSASMYYAYSGGISTLGSDDETGICALYPGGGGSPSDCTVTGCPAGEECVGGRCVPGGGGTPPTPGGGMCDACTTHSSCGSSGDYCLSYPDGSARCGVACASDGDCGGDRCLTLSNGARQCVRYSGSSPSCSGGGGTPGCTSDTDCGAGQRCDRGVCIDAGGGSAPLGDACAVHGDCTSGSCLAGMCVQSCDWPAGGCPGGFYCDGEATGACGAGVCLRGLGGAGALGDACSEHADCSNLYCFLGLCSEPCDPSTVGSCPGGGSCQVASLPCRGACSTAGSLGDPCRGNTDCASALCAEAAGLQFCTQICDASSPCPTGTVCTGAGAVNICVPDGGALGGECAQNEDCATGICAFEEDRAYCTRICDEASPCPNAMGCVASGTPGIRVCQPADGDLIGDRHLVGGCAAAPGPSAPALPLSLLALCLLVHRKRRRVSPER